MLLSMIALVNQILPSHPPPAPSFRNAADRPAPLRLTLICGSLEPGRDGVGDYCIRLAQALTAQGVCVSLLALSDHYVSQSSAQNGQILRLPAHWSSDRRLSLAARALEKWAPDWTSLQFVSWNHGPKGIVTREAALLRRLLQGHRLHLMMHEPWVTGSLEHIPSRFRRLRRALLGMLQKHSIAALIRSLQPKLINTSNAVYQNLLADIGVDAKQLPLFGNVDVLPPGDWVAMRDLVRESAGVDLPYKRDDVLLAGIFGALRPCPVEPALVALVAASAGRRVVLLSIGGAGTGGHQRLDEWKAHVPGLEVGMTGRLPAVAVSSVLGHLSVAISLHPASVVGRSGTAAALLEHGVPVICPWGVLPSKNDMFVRRWAGLLRPVDETLADFLRQPRKARAHSQMAGVTARVLLTSMAHSTQQAE